jgi:hypothetical protein
VQGLDSLLIGYETGITKEKTLALSQNFDIE